MTLAEVRLWGRRIGGVSLEEGTQTARFQYDPEFAGSGIELALLSMPLDERVFEFPGLPRSFQGLPGLLADSLPDTFGNALIDVWLATQGRSADSFNAVERLCYIGSRGMGALEFLPVLGPKAQAGKNVEVAALVRLAEEVLVHRQNLQGHFHKAETEPALNDILSVGTSAGGARAKAVIAWNPETNEVRSGQVNAGDGFEYWLLKFDGVKGNKDKEFEDPKGFGAIEYAYHLMAKEAGIEMSECRLMEEKGRRHFMTRRFDRLEGGEKLHVQSLGALCHYDFHQAGAYSYEQTFLAMRQLQLPMASVEQQFRRMLFNLVARNQDDHVKNIAFLMNRQGEWTLSPAFDVTYSYNPSGDWTATHQMSLNGKQDHFVMADIEQVEKSAMMKRGRGKTILEEVLEVVNCWPEFATEAGVSEARSKSIEKSHRVEFARK